MKKLKWKHLHGMKMYISDGENYAIESFGKNGFDMRVTFNEYSTIHIPFRKLSTAKKVAQLIHEG